MEKQRAHVTEQVKISVTYGTADIELDGTVRLDRLAERTIRRLEIKEDAYDQRNRIIPRRHGEQFWESERARITPYGSVRI